MNSDNTARLTTGPVPKTVLFLALPMVVGMFSIIAFNLADTFFVAQLGTQALAAMSFTFPVVMVMHGITIGLGTGAASAISRAIGGGDRSTVKRLATDSILMAIVVVMVFSLAGLLTIEPLFRLLGASPEVLPLIRQYMVIWYLGMPFLVIPMVGNSAIRATGDTKTPALIMTVSAGVNVILDPILIFGLIGFPRLEIMGAAIATVIARAITCAASLGILHFREHLLEYTIPRLRDVLDSWKQIAQVGVPAAGINLMMPVYSGIITRLAAGMGEDTVAAFGAGNRVSAVAFIPIWALTSTFIPFVGQNWGARLFSRVHEGRQAATLFSFCWGGVCIVLLWLVALPVAGLFSDDPEVQRTIRLFLMIAPFGYGAQGVFFVSTATLNAINRSFVSVKLTVVYLFFIGAPLAFLGAHFWAFLGLLCAAVMADISASVIAWVSARRVCRTEETKLVAQESTGYS